MEILKNVSIDWLKKKWYFFGLSWILLGLGVIGFLYHRDTGGFALGIDFKGGTVVNLKFNQSPDVNQIRRALKPEAVGSTVIQRFGKPTDNAVIVRMETVLQKGRNVDETRKTLEALLRQTFDSEHANTALIDLNNVGIDTVSRALLDNDFEKLAGQGKSAQDMQTYYQEMAAAIIKYRTQIGGGIIGSLETLKNVEGITPALIEGMKRAFYVGPFALVGNRSVGAVVGSDLRNRAALAVGLSFMGMLVYIGFRFKPIYGVGAIIALFHDISITLGLFALTQKEISLTVIAALLTLVGYSVNDTIVIFDRVRENLRTMRKDSLGTVINLSINQTLSRTIITSGMTFLAVFSLLLFGGEVLNGFSFALTVGIIIGSYSTLAIASPIVEWWYRNAEQKVKRKTA